MKDKIKLSAYALSYSGHSEAHAALVLVECYTKLLQLNGGQSNINPVGTRQQKMAFKYHCKLSDLAVSFKASYLVSLVPAIRNRSPLFTPSTGDSQSW